MEMQLQQAAQSGSGTTYEDPSSQYNSLNSKKMQSPPRKFEEFWEDQIVREQRRVQRLI
jgi:hypothetical protein